MAAADDSAPVYVDGRRVYGDAREKELERVAAHRRSMAEVALLDRLAAHWNNNMPPRERRALVALTLPLVEIDVRKSWWDLPFDHRVSLLNAFRQAVQFGTEIARALYS